MANLNKLLVHVPSSLCEDFRNKYIKGTDKSYDNKIVFLEDTKEIFTKGEIYGINVEDFNALKELVGTIPSEGGTTSTNIVDYINKKFSNLGTAAYKPVSYFDGAGAAADVKRELLGAESDKYTYNTIYGAKAYTYDAYNRIIGSENDDSTAYTIYGLRKYASNEAATYADTFSSLEGERVIKKFPVVISGSDNIIKVDPTTDSDGKTTYKISTSAEVFHYKGNKTTIEELLSTGNKTGDVWSVGPTNATGSTLYAWDGDEWINLGGANGVTGVDEDEKSISHGVKLVKNPNGTVKASVTTGSVASGNDLVVTGGATYTAIYNAKNQIHNYIDSLGGSETAHGSYIDVGVTTSGGKVSGVTVIATNTLTNALGKADSAIQRVRNLNDIISGDKYLNLSYQKSGPEIFIGLEKTQAFNYVTNNIWETYSV